MSAETEVTRWGWRVDRRCYRCVPRRGRRAAVAAEDQDPYRAGDGRDATLTSAAPASGPEAGDGPSPFVEGLQALLSGLDGAPSTRDLADGLGMLLDLLAAQVVELPAADGGSGNSGGNGRVAEGSGAVVQVVPEAEVLDGALALERLERRARAERLRRVGALDERRTWRRYGAGSTAGMLSRRPPLRQRCDEVVWSPGELSDLASDNPPSYGRSGTLLPAGSCAPAVDTRLEQPAAITPTA